MLGLVVNSIFSTKLAALFHIILCSPVHVAAPIISLLGGAYEWQARGSVKDSSAPVEVRRGGGGGGRKMRRKTRHEPSCVKKIFYFFLRLKRLVIAIKGSTKRRVKIASPNGSDAARLRLEYLFMFLLY
jgi:hypothetical protein